MKRRLLKSCKCLQDLGINKKLKNLRLKKNEEKRIKQGHAWVFSNEIDTKITPLKEFEAGEVVIVESANSKAIGIAYINPQTLICGRILSRNIKTKFNQAFIKKRIQTALSLRELNFDKPYYRLVFGDADGLPGLIIDRYADVFVAQITTAGMEKVKGDITATIKNLFQPQALVYRNDVAIRNLEGLDLYEEVALGKLPDQVILEENGAKFIIPVQSGQKTGWFYDHRMARKRLQALAKGKTVLDVFSYLGGWGIEAAISGAVEVVCVDSSATALDGVDKNAILNGIANKVTTLEGNAFDALKMLISEVKKFDIVIIDPPAFIKRKKDIRSGTDAYRRINELALRLVEYGGILVSASCSQHMTRSSLINQVQLAARHVDRSVQLFDQAHQAPDHPIHPAIPETEYIKTLFFKVEKAW